MKIFPRVFSIRTPRARHRMRGFPVAGILGLTVFFVAAACSNVDLEGAFKGKFPASKNNSVISSYCQTCHIHKDFDDEEHIAGVRQSYRRPVFREASECRVCHYLEKDWLRNDYMRKTRMPAKPRRTEN